MNKVIVNVVILLFSQIIFFIFPAIFYENIIYFLIIFNAFISWYSIKKVEKLYYKKYDKLSSMLYMLCPLVGVSCFLLLFYLIARMEVALYLMKYYILLFVIMYVINVIYIIFKNYLKR